MKLTVYSTNACAGCRAVIQELTLQGINHEVVKIDEDQEAMEKFKAKGYRSVPQVCTPEGELIADSLATLRKMLVLGKHAWRTL